MASPGFPQRKSQGAGGMTSSGGMSTPIDAPPPSPAGPPQTSSTSLGQPALPSFQEMAQPFTAGSPGKQLPPEILTGLMTAATTISGMLDNMASIAPDLANDFALQKDLLQRTLSKLLVQGAQPGAGSIGMNFPGGGFSGGNQ